MAFIRSEKSNYYLKKILSLIAGIAFTSTGLLSLVDDSEQTITVNGNPEPFNPLYGLLFLVFGLIPLINFIWMSVYTRRAILTDYDVQIELFFKTKKYRWEDFEYVTPAIEKLGGTYFKFKLRNGRAFYVNPDKGTMNPNAILDGSEMFKYEMSTLIDEMTE